MDTKQQILFTALLTAAILLASACSSSPPTTVASVTVHNTDSSGGTFTVLGSFTYQDGSVSAQESKSIDLVSGDSKVVTFIGATARAVASFDAQVVPPDKTVPRTEQRQVAVTYAATSDNGTNRRCGFLFLDTCAAGQVTLRNTDSAGGIFAVAGTFHYTDGTKAAQTLTVDLVSGDSKEVSFDGGRGRALGSFSYGVTAPFKTVSDIVQDQVPLTYTMEVSQTTK